jgi:ABC-type lipoprotein release transport system permease subunit
MTRLYSRPPDRATVPVSARMVWLAPPVDESAHHVVAAAEPIRWPRGVDRACVEWWMRVPVWLLVRRELRRQWRSLTVVALLVGLVGAVVLTAVEGARRTESAYPRLLDALHANEASVEVSPEYFDEIAALPQVEAVAPAAFMWVTPAGFEFGDFLPLAATDDRFNAVVDQPLLLDGRRPRPGRVGEVLVNEEAADRLGVEPGDVLTLTSFTPEQFDAAIDDDIGEPAGPELDVTVVGIGRTEVDRADRTPMMLFTPAFYARHRDDVGHFDDILQVRLIDGDRDMAAFRAGVQRVVPESEGAVIETQAETSTNVEDASNVEAVSLVLFAVAAGLAGFVAIGQALARQTALSTDDQPALQALGLSRRQRFAALVIPSGLVAIVGAAVGAGGALLASPLMPIGLARRIEPDAGFSADWVVLGLGCLAVIVLVSGRAALSAWRATGRVNDTSTPGRAARVVTSLARLGASPPMLTGVRMALEPGRGRTAVPVRAAWAGAVAGSAGLVAALTFGAALGWVVAEPAAYGMTWDTSVIGPSDGAGLEREVSALAEDDDVRAVAALSVVPLRLGGAPLQSYGLEPYEGGDFVTVLDGRAPQVADEVLVGSETLDRLGRHVGDTVVAEGLGGGARQELTIVGRGVFPELVHPGLPDSDTGAYNDYALLTKAGTDRFAGDAGDESFTVALVRWAPGVDGLAATRQLERSGAAVQRVGRPDRIVNLARVDDFPSAVAAFLVLVATIAAAHALVTSVRRRARDLAMLKALGFVASQARASVAWQASTLAAVGSVLGIPVGLVIGRSAWAIVAGRLGIDSHIPVPWLAVGLAVPGAFVVANLIAVVPGRRAARIRPATALRAE